MLHFPFPFTLFFLQVVLHCGVLVALSFSLFWAVIFFFCLFSRVSTGRVFFKQHPLFFIFIFSSEYLSRVLPLPLPLPLPTGKKKKKKKKTLR
eukprot:NODE_4196_length_600_cov_54.101633_g3027_i0.p3 GENE.NODE_4196_length_600_cov_54.101633_g3027_i0~~NODE_4196_length_600_cov_54.101633_g3027_i0.p3  ORF type:complete len:93 (+),score=27.45 NODE_4196_length_600_cov_54.101633_g3027_i0:319-597(+)